MSDITSARKALVTRVLEGDGTASHAQRRAAFDNQGLAEPLRALVDKVAKRLRCVGGQGAHVRLLHPGDGRTDVRTQFR